MHEDDFQKLTADCLNEAQIVVVKVGSSLLVSDDGTIKAEWLQHLAEDLAMLADRNCHAVIVSSGAIALGRRQLPRKNLKTRLKLEEKQAAAAIGQVQLASEWRNALEQYNFNMAQILLSPDDTETRRRHLNARATLSTLLQSGVIPVVNENDTVATMEIRYGDNDRLAARVAQMISADALILLSDIDGLYSADPHIDPTAQHIPKIINFTQDLKDMAGPAHTEYSSGGMVTKIEAARIATEAGCHMAICNGKALNPIKKLLMGDKASWFVASAKPRQARKAWIASSLQLQGSLYLDKGAVAAIHQGKSLLPAGITTIEGDFERGDLVAICDTDKQEIGRGLCNYTAHDAKRIIGHNSTAIQSILGYRGRNEIIHADDLVMTNTP